MSLPVRIRPEAEADLQSAYRWYEDQSDGRGVRFLGHVDEAFARVSKNIASATEFEVIAVLHAGRNPSTWQVRTSS